MRFRCRFWLFDFNLHVSDCWEMPTRKYRPLFGKIWSTSRIIWFLGLVPIHLWQRMQIPYQNREAEKQHHSASQRPFRIYQTPSHDYANRSLRVSLAILWSLSKFKPIKFQHKRWLFWILDLCDSRYLFKRFLQPNNVHTRNLSTQSLRTSISARQSSQQFDHQ